MNSDIEKLMQPNTGEAIEQRVESAVHAGKKAAADLSDHVRRHPKFAITGMLSAVALAATLYWGIPFAIHKYHESRAAKDITAAETAVHSLIVKHKEASGEVEQQKFIIPDDKENTLERSLAGVTPNFKRWLGEIDHAKAQFARKEFRLIRDRFEDAEEPPKAGLITTIKSGFVPVQSVIDYARQIRSLRDQALHQETVLASECKQVELGFPEAALNTTLGTRVQAARPALERILRIARRAQVRDNAKAMDYAAKRSFSEGFSFYTASSFVRYSTSLDNTLDIPDYQRVVAAQATVVSRIKSGDASLAEISKYLVRLEEQWLTRVTHRRESSHQEKYFVTVDNPAYREWTDQEPYSDEECTTSYTTQTRSRANDDGTVDTETVEVPETDCKPVTRYRTVHKDNGEPETIQEARFRTIPEYWVTTETHRFAMRRIVTDDTVDLKELGLWRARQHQQGFQVWKPYGDDQEYNGFGRIGPMDYQEIPRLVEPVM